MNIAVTYENGDIFQHFGRMEQFKLYTVENGKVIASEVVGNNGIGHGALASLLQSFGVDGKDERIDACLTRNEHHQCGWKRNRRLCVARRSCGRGLSIPDFPCICCCGYAGADIQSTERNLSALLLMLYDLSDETVRLVLILAFLHNLFNALFCPLSYSFSSGLRAAGDVKFNLYSSIFSSVICRVTLSAVFGIRMNMGVIGITLAMICDWGVKVALVVNRYRSGKWKTFQLI